MPKFHIRSLKCRDLRAFISGKFQYFGNCAGVKHLTNIMSEQPVPESAAGSQTTLPGWKSNSWAALAQSEAVMDALAEVEIDKEGKFKYILVKVWPASGKEEEGKLVVRGTAEAEFHPDIMAKVNPFYGVNKISS